MSKHKNPLYKLITRLPAQLPQVDVPLGELVDQVHVAVLGRDVDGSVAHLKCEAYAPKRKNTRTGLFLVKMFCRMFSESSTVELQLACCPGKQGEFSKKKFIISYKSSGPF